MREPSIKKDLQVPLLQKVGDEPTKIRLSMVHIIAYIISFSGSLVFLKTKHWCLHNIFAISFSLQAVAIISLGRFVVAFILLAGLFIYDIFWVFGTDVMVSVAKQFEGPAKIIFPVSFDPWKQSILGLGDIVIPGIFIAMTLRMMRTSTGRAWARP